MFYVYEHYRKDSGEIFYVGKGCKSRAWSHYNRNIYWHRIVKKHGLKAKIVAKFNDEKEALNLEILLIEKYGRKDLGLGPLVNMTNGGDGFSPFDARETALKLWSDKTKREKIITALNNSRSKDHMQKMRDAAKSPEAREKKSKKLKGRYFSELTREKISKAASLRVGAKNPAARSVVCVEICKHFTTIKDAAEYFDLSPSNISNVIAGNQKTSGGYRWMYYDDWVKTQKQAA